MNRTVMTTIVALSLCFNAFVQEAKGKDWTEQEWEKEKGRHGYGWVFPHIDKNADGKVSAAEYEAFQKYKKQHPNWEAELKLKAEPVASKNNEDIQTWIHILLFFCAFPACLE